MAFINIYTGDITGPALPGPLIGGSVPVVNNIRSNDIRINAANFNLTAWLSELYYLGQVLSVESYANKSAVNKFNKISNSARKLAAKLGVKNLPIAAVYNPLGITDRKQWTIKFNGIIGRQRQVFAEANVNNQAGISREELVLAREWASWRSTFFVQLNGPRPVLRR
jgi:hypothetical protein